MVYSSCLIYKSSGHFWHGGPHLVEHLKHMIFVFKQHYTHFYALFDPHVFQKNTNNITQTPLSNGPLMFDGCKYLLLEFSNSYRHVRYVLFDDLGTSILMKQAFLIINLGLISWESSNKKSPQFSPFIFVHCVLKTGLPFGWVMYSSRYNACHQDIIHV